jgi:hypothetical protein
MLQCLEKLQQLKSIQVIGNIRVDPVYYDHQNIGLQKTRKIPTYHIPPFQRFYALQNPKRWGKLFLWLCRNGHEREFTPEQ